MAIAPAVAPTPRDADPRRATYDVPYPLGDGADLVFATKEDVITRLPAIAAGNTKRRVAARRISITVTLRTFEDIVFAECNFHDQRGLKPATINKVTFRRCDFSRCFFGTLYCSKVRFIDCSFEHCDFTKDEFSDCTFERCRFTRCSAEDALFQRSEIDPDSFLDSITFPEYNLLDKGDEFRARLSREWLHIRLRVAEQIFRSNNDIFNSDFADRALYQLKRAQVLVAADRWRYGAAAPSASRPRLAARIFGAPFALMRLGVQWVNLWLTKGGTSLSRLGGLLLVAIAAYPFLLTGTGTSYEGARFGIVDPSGLVVGYAKAVLRSAALFLGFGFDKFSTESFWGSAALVGASSFGLVSYALLISVLLRRIYR